MSESGLKGSKKRFETEAQEQVQQEFVSIDQHNRGFIVKNTKNRRLRVYIDF